MSRWVRYTLLALLFLASLVCVSGAEALSKNYAKAFKLELATIIHARPRYTWGGSESEKKGLDCSGYLYLAARRAGMPVRRTTARRMALGESGWASEAVSKLESARDLDLILWTLKPSRPNGHVGIILRVAAKSRVPQEAVRMQRELPAYRPGSFGTELDFYRNYQVTHASSGRNQVVVDKIRGWVIKRMTSIRRLTIGD